VTTRVLIADDQPLMRRALRISLDAEPDLEVVGEAADGRDAIELAGRLQPHVVVMDIRMPTLDGISATRALLAACPSPAVRVLALTTFNLDDYLLEALRAGASGFVLKDTTPEELAHAVRVIAAGEALLCPSVTRRLLDRFAHRLPPAGADAPQELARLTPREVDVLQLVARGLSNADIGEALHVAASSVKTHVSHLLAKLGMADRVHLVVFAYESGLVRAGSL
jgi:DNA-binding NarL/FixJ family response regulator